MRNVFLVGVVALALGILVGERTGRAEEKKKAATPAPAAAKNPCSWDGSADCDCVFNHDCGAGYRCEEVKDDLIGECRKGARGTKAFEAECKTGNDCESGKCIFENEKSNVARCTKSCAEKDGPCKGKSFKQCNDAMYVCIPPSN